MDDPADSLLRSVGGRDYAGFGVVVSHTEALRRFPKRRAITLNKEIRRLELLIGQVVTTLSKDDLGSAAALVAASEFQSAITLTTGHAALQKAAAHRLQCGDNVSSETMPADNVIVLTFWHDPTHGKVC